MIVRVNGDGLDAVLRAVSDAARIAPTDARKVVAKGALNIKDDARRRIRGLAHARAYPSSITYDLWPNWRGAVAEIGPDKAKRQGALGNLLEYGSVNNPPHPHLAPALAAERPRFERAMEDLAVDALGL